MGALEVLSWQLKQFCPDWSVIGTFSDALEGLDAIQRLNPTLTFLDIEMPHMNGIEIASKVRAHTSVVFTTAYNQFAVQAFKVNALDYLLKPIDPDDLIATLDRIHDRLQPTSNGLEAQLQSLIERINPLHDDKVALPSQHGMVIRSMSDIIRCESDSNYTTIILKNERILVSKTLKEVEKVLDPRLFFRVHLSHLINLAHVTAYHRGEGGDVVMSDGTVIAVARNRKQDFLTHFKKI